MRKHILQLFILILTFVIWSNFGFAADEKPDYWPTRGWRTATPESQGMDSQKLVDMMDLICQGLYSIDSLLIIRNGYLVFEVYGYSYNKDITHNLFSCSKSVTSSLIGIAIDKGYIKGVNQPLLDFFPDRVAENLEADKKAITLEHVLTMTTGLQCQDSYLYMRKGLWRMHMSDDWVKFMLDMPMAEKPGTHFEYCNGATFLLSAILQKQTGMTALTFAEKYLFSPLGITKTDWTSNLKGINTGYGWLYMLPCDMAKIGYLYLNDGLWEGKRILSSQWVKASTQKYVSATLADGYGYQWWIGDPNTFHAIGAGGQLISVVKNKNLVVVFTATNDLLGTAAVAHPELVKLFISPAVKSSAPLPENPQAIEALKSLAEKYQSKVVMEEYINKEIGFSVKYDAKIFAKYYPINRSAPSIVFKKQGSGDFYGFFVFVEDIPPHLALKDTGDYLVKKTKGWGPNSTNFNVYKQELTKLSDGTDANYFEISWRSPILLDVLNVGIFAFKNNKMIGVFTSSSQGIPIEYLADMVKTFKFLK